MNVLKEGKTYYLSSVNSQFPLIPCDEALQYLKLPIQNEAMNININMPPSSLLPMQMPMGYPPQTMGYPQSMGFPPSPHGYPQSPHGYPPSISYPSSMGMGMGYPQPMSYQPSMQYPPAAMACSSMTSVPAELIAAYAPPNGHYSLPLSMIPIHTQSVLYPSMQYFPPLSSTMGPPPSSVVAAATASIYDGSDLKRSDNEEDSDTSDEEGFDYSSAHANLLQLNPNLMSMMMQHQQQQQQQQQQQEQEQHQSGSDSSSSSTTGATSSLPLHYEFNLPFIGQCSSSSMLPVMSSIEMAAAAAAASGLVSPYHHLSENMTASSVLLKRTRDEYETLSSNPLDDQDQRDTFTMTPSVLPPFSSHE
jgi:hypothetical protein